jgi:8-oxo-dGTP diphosphatase
MKLQSQRKYITARAIIIRDGKMLAFYRKRRDSTGGWIEYYSIPGGELDKGEKPEDAVVRELSEEMGVDIKPKGLVAHSKDTVFEHYIFSAEIVKGEPHFMSESEEARHYVNENNQYQVVWVPVRSLTRENLKFYGLFYDHIVALAAGKPVYEVGLIKL